MGPSSETFTLHLRADDAAILYIDHELVIDAWEGTRVLMNSTEIFQRIPWLDFSVVSALTSSSRWRDVANFLSFQALFFVVCPSY